MAPVCNSVAYICESTLIKSNYWNNGKDVILGESNNEDPVFSIFALDSFEKLATD